MACHPGGHYWGCNIILVLPDHSYRERHCSLYEYQGPNGELCSRAWLQSSPMGSWYSQEAVSLFLSYTLSHNYEWWGWLHLIAASVMTTRMTSPIEESENVIATNHLSYMMYNFLLVTRALSAIFLTSLCQVIIVCFCSFFSNFGYSCLVFHIDNNKLKSDLLFIGLFFFNHCMKQCRQQGIAIWINHLHIHAI